MANSMRITGNIRVETEWFMSEYGMTEPNPFTIDLDELAEFKAEKTRLIYERYPESKGQSPAPIPQYQVPMRDGRVVCTMALGAPEPVWDEKSGCWWTDKACPPLKGIKSISDVDAIPIPDWSNVSLVQQMIDKYREVREKSKYKLDLRTSLQWLILPWTNPATGESYQFDTFMSFIDLGAFLMGDTDFFSMLAIDPDLSKAMFKKCFDLSTGYSDFMRGVYGVEVSGICSFGGDYSCILSPEMYKNYAMTRDAMLIDKYGNLPCNLHSCGPSDHLYEIWGTYPNIENIILMQTRGMSGKLRQLRKSLPDTHLQITLCSPQFDFERESTDNVRGQLREYAEHAGFGDISFTAIISGSNSQVDENVQTFFETIEEINMAAATT